MEDLVTIAPAELAEWSSFWHAHESHVFSSKRLTFKAPLSNKTKISNSSIQSFGSYLCTFIQAARDDVARSFMFESDGQSFKREGRLVGGKDPSTAIVDKDMRKHPREYIDEFKEYMAGKIQLNPSHDVPVCV